MAPIAGEGRFRRGISKVQLLARVAVFTTVAAASAYVVLTPGPGNWAPKPPTPLVLTLPTVYVSGKREIPNPDATTASVPTTSTVKTAAQPAP